MPTEIVKELLMQPWNQARKQFKRLYATHQMTLSGGSILRAADQAGVHRNTLKRLLQEEN